MLGSECLETAEMTSDVIRNGALQVLLYFYRGIHNVIHRDIVIGPYILTSNPDHNIKYCILDLKTRTSIL